MMKNYTFLLLLMVLPIFASAQVWEEDFDGANTTNLPAFSYTCFGSSRDYLNTVCDDGVGCTNEINADYVYNASMGEYLGARDTDHNGCTANLAGETVSFTGIDISSCSFPSVMYLCFTVAESRNMNGAFGAEWSASCNGGVGCEDTWDGNTSVMISASVDGAAATPVTAIEASVGSDSRPGIDVNCDGDAGDSGEPELTDMFTEYCFELPLLGATLDLEFELIGFNTGGEDVAIDDISIHCTTDPSSLTGTQLDACTPFTPVDPSVVWKENFDGSNTTNPFNYPCIIDDSRDYFGEVCLDGGGCADDINSDYTYSGVQGSFFGARDINGDPCGTDNPVTSSATGIDISSCGAGNTLYLCFDIAESDSQPREGTDTWDGNQSNALSNSFLTFMVSIDGGAATDILSFAAVGNNNSGPASDLDCDGTGDGVLVTETFATFCAELPATGSSLDLFFTIGGLNTDGDDVALDNICITCTNDPGTLPAVVTPACLDALPVSLTYFSGRMEEGSSILSWETIQELNNDYFEIEHSTDGRSFSALGKIKGQGSVVQVNRYEYIHKNPQGKENYYRLKQVDFDGSFEYSNVVYLQGNFSAGNSIIYPNPAYDAVTYEGAAASLVFYDVHGRQVKQIDAQEGVTVLDISNMEVGVYMIEILGTNQEIEYQRFIKN